MMLHKKRGNVVLVLFEVIGLVLILSILGYSATREGLGETVLKSFYAKDIALTLDTIYAVPGDISYRYKGDMTRFRIEAVQGRVVVSAGEMDFQPEKYSFASFEENEPDIGIEGQENLVITKSGEVISFVNEEKIPSSKLVLPEVEIKEKISEQTLVIDPAGSDEKMLPTVNRKESEQTWWIAQYFTNTQTGFKRTDITRMETESKSGEERISFIQEKSPDILIIIRFGSYNSNTKNPVIAFYPQKLSSTMLDKNIKLAGSIANSLKETFPETDMPNVIPWDSDDVLNSNGERLAVLLELGNTELKRASFINEPNQIGAAVYKGVVNYYKNAEK
ncbi:hypothetical protein JXA85_07425 [Candidatus Woesearchaeota archaeon]|nr:hypothetical protein [Candidatus Woesearchaeota archaeon]